jgi:hypothetical protein
VRVRWRRVGEGEGEGAVVGEWGGALMAEWRRWTGAGSQGGGAGDGETGGGAGEEGGAAGGGRRPRQVGPTCRRLRERDGREAGALMGRLGPKVGWAAGWAGC